MNNSRLTLLRLEPTSPPRYEPFGVYRCLCGKEKLLRVYSVKRGVTRSCGCLHKERCASGLNSTKHGMAKKGQVTRMHSIWRGMLKRCNPTNNKWAIQNYADRGITVCPEWQSFKAFKEWSESNGYADNLTIDRRDNDVGYSPANCRWVDRKEQARNRRTTRFITVNGITRALSAWLEVSGVKKSAFHYRESRGKSMSKCLGTCPEFVKVS